jgi:hypothetical protein
MRRGFVYFIADGDDAVKVGWSDQTFLRIKTLQTGNPRPLRLLMELPGDQAREMWFQGLFADRRISGEWFAPSIPVSQAKRVADAAGPHLRALMLAGPDAEEYLVMEQTGLVAPRLREFFEGLDLAFVEPLSPETP